MTSKLRVCKMCGHHDTHEVFYQRLRTRACHPKYDWCGPWEDVPNLAEIMNKAIKDVRLDL
jgi:hypothetical protein